MKSVVKSMAMLRIERYIKPAWPGSSGREQAFHNFWKFHLGYVFHCMKIHLKSSSTDTVKNAFCYCQNSYPFWYFLLDSLTFLSCMWNFSHHYLFNERVLKHFSLLMQTSQKDSQPFLFIHQFLFNLCTSWH